MYYAIIICILDRPYIMELHTFEFETTHDQYTMTDGTRRKKYGIKHQKIHKIVYTHNSYRLQCYLRTFFVPVQKMGIRCVCYWLEESAWKSITKYNIIMDNFFLCMTIALPYIDIFYFFSISFDFIAIFNAIIIAITRFLTWHFSQKKKYYIACLGRCRWEEFRCHFLSVF